MKEYTTDKIRNIAMVSHIGAGKTMLTEAFLMASGVTNRLGTVEENSTVSDFDNEEQRRQLSLSTSVIPIEHNGVKINLLDTPGFPDFVGEVISAVRVADSALVVVDSVAGVEVGTEIAWKYCNVNNLPRFVLINRMHRETADFRGAIESVRQLTNRRLIPVQLPWGEREDFKGLINLLDMKAYPAGDNPGEEIPADLLEEAKAARQELVEAAAEGNDEALEKYLDGEVLTPEEVMNGLQGVVGRALFVPIFLADASDKVGIKPLLDAFDTLMPAPNERPDVVAKGVKGEEILNNSDTGPLAAYVWKTTADPFVGKITYFRLYSGMLSGDTRVWNAEKGEEERMANLSVPRGKEQISIKNMHAGDIGSVLKLGDTDTTNTLCDKGHPVQLPSAEYPSALYRVAVKPATQADATKMGATLSRLCEEDMTLSWFNEPSTKQTILRGMGDQHIDVAIRRAEAKFQTKLVTEEPRVPYRETITKKADAQYRHKKQSGGSGQFGEVYLRIEPLPDENFQFVNEVVGGSVSSNYMTSIEKGIKGVMDKGVIAGFPVHNVLAAVYDGKEHAVDSKPVAFEIAGREAFKLAVKDANPVLLEPIMDVKVTVPEVNMGDVFGDMNSRRGRVQGTDVVNGRTIISAKVPLAEMLRYTSELRSMTGGRGIFEMEESHYERVPNHLQSEIVAAMQQDEEEEE
jgi:elongation factor G